MKMWEAIKLLQENNNVTVKPVGDYREFRAIDGIITRMPHELDPDLATLSRLEWELVNRKEYIVDALFNHLKGEKDEK